MPRIRSTSPPKSAWPGVSMMLMRVSPASPDQGVHGAFDGRLVRPEGAGLGEKLVDQGGLAVVDVGDDGDIAKLHDVLICGSARL